jgi:hypothetical protein
LKLARRATGYPALLDSQLKREIYAMVKTMTVMEL